MSIQMLIIRRKTICHFDPALREKNLGQHDYIQISHTCGDSK